MLYVEKMKIAVLGASGKIGRALAVDGLARGHSITGQSRKPKVSLPAGVVRVVADPRDAAALKAVVAGQDAVIYALGYMGRGNVQFFSETTTALLSAMQNQGVRRLIAITGVGAGSTRGHGGWFYDRVVFPLFTCDAYADKDRQEHLIRESGLIWTILRPAAFHSTPGREPFHALTDVKSNTRLSRVTPQEVAAFALDCAERGLYCGDAVFFGHGVAE